MAVGDVPRGTSTASHLVWGRVPLTDIAAAVVALERGSTSASKPVEQYLNAIRPACAS
jgi:hypothetical protein